MGASNMRRSIGGEGMSMHMVGPHLNRTQTSRKKKKRKVSKAVVEFQKLDTSQYGPYGKFGDQKPYSLPKVDSNRNIPSKSMDVAAVCSKKEPHEYTGDYIKGIAQTHKSNAVPVTSNEQILDISNMRRTK